MPSRCVVEKYSNIFSCVLNFRSLFSYLKLARRFRRVMVDTSWGSVVEAGVDEGCMWGEVVQLAVRRPTVEANNAPPAASAHGSHLHANMTTVLTLVASSL
jgi:hypothetical protein